MWQRYSHRKIRVNEIKRTGWSRRKRESYKKASKKYQMKKMCCGLWPAKGDEGSRKIADKGMQMKTGMGNVEEGIAQEGNANTGKVLRWCSRNVTKEEDRSRESVREKGRLRIERARGDTERRCERENAAEGKGGGDRRVVYGLKEGWSTRMVSRRSLAVWHPSTAQTTTTRFRQACARLLLSNHRAPALISQPFAG